MSLRHCNLAACPLLFYRRASVAVALKMLSSTSAPDPNPKLTSINATLNKSTSESKSSNLPLSADPKNGIFNCRDFTLSGCPCSATSTDSIPNVLNTECLLVVVSFYRFADFTDHADLRKPLKQLCEELHVSGGIILAPEGINGSLCGTRDSVEKVIAFIQTDDRLKGLRRVESPVSPEEEANSSWAYK